MSDGLTVKERIALLKKQNNKDSNDKPADPVKPVGKLNVSSFGNSNNKSNEVRSPSNTNSNSSNSIADRIAAMKVSSSEPMNTDNSNSSSPDTAKKMGVADKIAALKAKSAADSAASTSPKPVSDKPVTVKESPPAVINSTEVTMSSDSEKVENTEQSTDGNTRRLSIAERIAAMKSQNTSKSEDPPKHVVIAHSSSNDTAVATSPNDRASAAPGASQNATPTENRKGSIADKIAALKASSATKGGPPIGTMSPGSAPPASKATKRLSSDRAAFGAGLNMAMLMPGMTPPSMVKRPPVGEDDDDMSRDSESDSTTSSRRSSTEIKHMSLGRPSVASVRKTRGRTNSYVKSVRMSTTDFVAEDGVDIKDIIATTSSINADTDMVIDEEQADGDAPMEE